MDNFSGQIVGQCQFQFKCHEHKNDRRSVVVDFLPQGRTLIFRSVYGGFEGHIFLKFPYLRFIIGFEDRFIDAPTERFWWDRSIFLYGDTKPFGREFSGFAMPLPNFMNIGYLNCVGTMPRRRGRNLFEIVVPVISDFWNSSFYSKIEETFMTIDGLDILSLDMLKELGPAVYDRLPRIDGRDARFSDIKLEWAS